MREVFNNANLKELFTDESEIMSPTALHRSDSSNTKWDRRPHAFLDNRNMMNQSQENQYKYHNFVLNRNQKLKQKYLDELESVKQEYYAETDRINAKAQNNSFEKLTFEPNVENQILAVNANIENSRKILHSKNNLVSEAVNGLVSVYHTLGKTNDFSRYSTKTISNDTSSVSQIMLVLNRRI